MDNGKSLLLCSHSSWEEWCVNHNVPNRGKYYKRGKNTVQLGLTHACTEKRRGLNTCLQCPSLRLLFFKWILDMSSVSQLRKIEVRVQKDWVPKTHQRVQPTEKTISTPLREETEGGLSYVVKNPWVEIDVFFGLKHHRGHNLRLEKERSPLFGLASMAVF
jgi:hypothetical protein